MNILKLRLLHLAGAIVLPLVMAGSAVAGTLAVQSFTAGSLFIGFSPSVDTVGWTFSVTAGNDISVTSLGWWDATPGSDLAATHEVGLWQTDGTLLTSTTIQTTSTLNGSFRYESVTPVTLLAGTTYIIAGSDPSADGDNYTSGVSSLVTDSRISFLQSARNTTNGFSLPTVFANTSGGRFGPNFEFDEISDAPEPGSMTLLLAGGIFLAGRLRRAART